MWSCVSVLSKLIIFSLMTVEGTYEFVGKNKTQVVYFVFIAGDEEHN